MQVLLIGITILISLSAVICVALAVTAKKSDKRLRTLCTFPKQEQKGR